MIYDAVDVSAIPTNASTILAYIDGDYVTLGEVQARFPKARILTVTTTGLNRADICDVESGDATPAIAANGVKAGLYSTVYSATSTKADLDTALVGLTWNWFAADPTGVEHLVAGSVATQWAWPGHGSPGNYDMSVTNGVWPAASPSPSPTFQEQPTMFCTDPQTGGTWSTDGDGELFAEFGAPFVQGLNQHPDYHAGGTESAGANPCVGIAACKDSTGQWGLVYFTFNWDKAPDGSPYHTYRFRRDGTPD